MTQEQFILERYKTNGLDGVAHSSCSIETEKHIACLFILASDYCNNNDGQIAQAFVRKMQFYSRKTIPKRLLEELDEE